MEEKKISLNQAYEAQTDNLKEVCDILMDLSRCVSALTVKILKVNARLDDLEKEIKNNCEQQRKC